MRTKRSVAHLLNQSIFLACNLDQLAGYSVSKILQVLTVLLDVCIPPFNRWIVSFFIIFRNVQSTGIP